MGDKKKLGVSGLSIDVRAQPSGNMTASVCCCCFSFFNLFCFYRLAVPPIYEQRVYIIFLNSFSHFFCSVTKKKIFFLLLLFPNKSVTIHARSEHVREKSFCCCFSSSIKQTCSFEKLTSRWWWGSTGECSLFPTLSREKRRRTSYPGLDLFCCCFSPGLPVSHDSQLSA